MRTYKNIKKSDIDYTNKLSPDELSFLDAYLRLEQSGNIKSMRQLGIEVPKSLELECYNSRYARNMDAMSVSNSFATDSELENAVNAQSINLSELRAAAKRRKPRKKGAA